jgi:hypothetical protein
MRPDQTPNSMLIYARFTRLLPATHSPQCSRAKKQAHCTRLCPGTRLSTMHPRSRPCPIAASPLMHAIDQFRPAVINSPHSNKTHTFPCTASATAISTCCREGGSGHTMTSGSRGRCAPFSTDTSSHTNTARSLACPLLTLSSQRFSHCIFRSICRSLLPPPGPPVSSSLTHARRMDGFCNQNADCDETEPLWPLCSLVDVWGRHFA